MESKDCPCGSRKEYTECCFTFISKNEIAKTALDLMKSRYSAYVMKQIDYLYNTTHKSVQHLTSKEGIKSWADETVWQKLEIIYFKEDIVEFKAYYKDLEGINYIHHERSNFHFENDQWFYVDGNYYE